MVNRVEIPDDRLRFSGCFNIKHCLKVNPLRLFRIGYGLMNAADPGIGDHMRGNAFLHGKIADAFYALERAVKPFMLFACIVGARFPRQRRIQPASIRRSVRFVNGMPASGKRHHIVFDISFPIEQLVQIFPGQEHADQPVAFGGLRFAAFLLCKLAARKREQRQKRNAQRKDSLIFFPAFHVPLPPVSHRISGYPPHRSEGNSRCG